MSLIQTEPKKIYIRVDEIIPYLCFTANTANSTIQLTKTGSPTVVTLETSPDMETWTTYTLGDTITLSNIGDKVYWRNTSETDTGFNIDISNGYTFVMSGSISGSGDINYLLNKNSTDTVSQRCFYRLFRNCTSLTTSPSLPATNIASRCYASMFQGCVSLTTAPSLPATTVYDYCYNGMFYGCTSLVTLSNLPALTLAQGCYMRMYYDCSSITLNTTQTGIYQTAYRIPTTGSGTTATNALMEMFYSHGGDAPSTPTINTTYYTSNTLV